jgi:hypothetical protein
VIHHEFTLECCKLSGGGSKTPTIAGGLVYLKKEEASVGQKFNFILKIQTGIIIIMTKLFIGFIVRNEKLFFLFLKLRGKSFY